MKKNYKVYGLIDPRTNLIKYVGITKRNLELRLSEHINTRRKYNTYKIKWIDKLKSIQLLPTIILIENNLTKESACEKEIYYIDFYKSNKLVNGTTGGESGFQVKKSSINRLKISLTGRSLSEEHKKNIGIASQRPCTESAKKKLRKKAKKQWSNPELLNKMKERVGSNNPNYGGSKGPVCQLNDEGIVLNEYNCIGDAATALGINQKSLRGTINRGTRLDGCFYKFKKDI
jgi:hypothetical protein